MGRVRIIAARPRLAVALLAAVVVTAIGAAYASDPPAFVATTRGAWPLLALIAIGAAALPLSARLPRARMIAIGLVVSVIASTAAFGAEYAATRQSFSDVARSTQFLLAHLQMAADADVYAVREPYAAGRTLVVQPELGEPSTYRTTQPTRFFMVDDHPLQRFSHPVRYVFLGQDGSVFIRDATWLATVNDVQSWSIDATARFGTHSVALLSPAGLFAARPSPITATERAIESLADAIAPIAYAADKRKLAVVIDGGDALMRLPAFAQEESYRLGRIAIRDQMTREADAVAAALKGRGYDVVRLSGSPNNDLPAPSRLNVGGALTRARDSLGDGDSLILYVTSHGSPDASLALHDKGGADRVMRYDTLAGWVGDLSKLGIDTSVVIDACFSGSAEGAFKDLKGVALYTATDAKSIAPGGVGNDPSYGKEILKALAEPGADLNKDGIVTPHEAFLYAQSAVGILDVGATFLPAKGAAPSAAARAATPTPTSSPSPTPRSPTPTPTPSPSPAATQAARQTLVPVALPPAPAPLSFTAGPFVDLVAGSDQPWSFCVPAPLTPTSECGAIPVSTNPSGGNPPYHCQLDSGIGFPPPGVTLSKDCVLRGKPADVTAGHTYDISVCAIDLSGTQVCRPVTIRVGAPAAPVALTFNIKELQLLPPGTITISWNAIQTATHYCIALQDVTTGSFLTPSNACGSFPPDARTTSTFYSRADFPGGHRYQFTAEAWSGGQLLAYNMVSFRTSGDAAPTTAPGANPPPVTVPTTAPTAAPTTAPTTAATLSISVQCIKNRAGSDYYGSVTGTATGPEGAYVTTNKYHHSWTCVGWTYRSDACSRFSGNGGTTTFTFTLGSVLPGDVETVQLLVNNTVVVSKPFTCP